MATKKTEASKTTKPRKAATKPKTKAKSKTTRKKAAPTIPKIGETGVSQGRSDQEKEQAAYLADCLQADDWAGGKRKLESQEIPRVLRFLCRLLCCAHYLSLIDDIVCRPKYALRVYFDSDPSAVRVIGLQLSGSNT